MALVTGAGRRIGAAIAQELAHQGWDLALHHRHSGQEAQALGKTLKTLGGRAECFQADLSEEDQTQRLVERVVSTLGRLDAVINNASVFEYDSIADFSYARLEYHWRTNTAAPIALARALHAHVSSRSHPDSGPAAAPISPCVINLLDQKLWNPNPDYLSYTLSKAALEAANTLLAQALAPQVRVCGLAPGVTLVSGPMSESGFQSAHTMTPLGRSSTPQDIARAAAFLLQSPAITGTTLLVDGGQHLSAQGRDVLFLTPEANAPR